MPKKKGKKGDAAAAPADAAPEQAAAPADAAPELAPEQVMEQVPEQIPESAPPPAAEEASPLPTAETAGEAGESPPESVGEASVAAGRPAVQQTLRATPGVCQVCRSTSKVVLIEQQTIASGSITIPGTYLCQSCIEDQPQSTDWKVWMQWRQRKGGA